MWTVILTSHFENWLNQQNVPVQEKVLAALGNLEAYGPKLPRPYADTIKGSKYSNMKELRIQHSGKALRAFFAFDFKRQAIVLCAGDKSNNKRFYQTMIQIADNEFMAYLALMERKMKTLRDAIAERSPQSQSRIKALTEEMVLETGLQLLREELNISQKMLAENLGISQPAITQIERRGNDLKLATLKRYVEAMGGKLSLTIELPTGHDHIFHI